MFEKSRPDALTFEYLFDIIAEYRTNVPNNDQTHSKHKVILATSPKQ